MPSSDSTVNWCDYDANHGFREAAWKCRWFRSPVCASGIGWLAYIQIMIWWQSILQPPLNWPRCTHDVWNIDWNQIICLRILLGSILVVESLISTLWTARKFATLSHHSKNIRSWHRHYKTNWKCSLMKKCMASFGVLRLTHSLSRSETIAFFMTHDQPQRPARKAGRAQSFD